MIDINKLKTKGKLDTDKVENMIKNNPIVEPVSSSEVADFSVKLNRTPYTDFPEELPVFGKMPLPPDEHKHIGMYENKQNLYLLFAHAYNKLMNEIKDLKDEIEILKGK